MKKQNIIIVSIFIILIIFFYLFNYFNNKADEEVDLEEVTEEKIETNELMPTIETTMDKENNVVIFYDVYVHGEVYKSDIYHIPSNWTLDKLFTLAGLKSTADISSFNLSEVVENKKEYYIPKKNIKNNNSNITIVVNINTASKQELMTLPGIGEVIAERIIIYRQKTKFKSIEDIKNVSGIGDTVYEKIKDFITV